MTWKQIQVAALQKMFAIPGSDILQDEGVKQYLAAMPQAANEAIQLIVAKGKGKVKSFTLHHAPKEQKGSTCYGLSALAPEYYRMAQQGCRLETGGETRVNPPYYLRDGHSLVLQNKLPGTYHFSYYSCPPPITHTTAENTVIPLPAQCALLLPLYIASQLYKEDDLSLATVYRNEFEAALDRVPPEESAEGFEWFVCESGWI